MNLWVCARLAEVKLAFVHVLGLISWAAGLLLLILGIVRTTEILSPKVYLMLLSDFFWWVAWLQFLECLLGRFYSAGCCLLMLWTSPVCFYAIQWNS